MSKELATAGSCIGFLTGIALVGLPGGLGLLSDAKTYSGDLETMVFSILVIIFLTIIGGIIGGLSDEIAGAFS